MTCTEAQGSRVCKATVTLANRTGIIMPRDSKLPHLLSCLCSAGNEVFNIDPPPCFLIFNLFNISFTSLGLPVVNFDFAIPFSAPLDLVGASLWNPSVVCAIEVWSSVETEGALLTRAGLDIEERPSRASRRSVTPTPRVERARD